MSSSTSNIPSPTVNSASNLQNFLRSATPIIRSKQVQNDPNVDTQNGNPVTEFFKMEDLWMWYEEPSACGIGTKFILDNGEAVTNHYTPHISSLQIYSIKSSKISSLSKPEKKDESVVVEFDSDLYMQYFVTDPPEMKMPMFDKISTLSEDFPGIMSLKSTDLSPASWMAVAWYPIYAIPDRPNVKDLSSCFLTFHLLSPSSQETIMINEDKDQKSTKHRGDILESPREISLPPFRVAKYKANGEVWTNEESSDWKRLNELHGAADSWLKKYNKQHHDIVQVDI